MGKAMQAIDLDAIRKTIEDINYECAKVGLRAVDRRGKQKEIYWLPEEIKKLLIAENQRPDGEKTEFALVKYFSPVGSATWWFSEYDPEDDTFFGKAELQFKELGRTSRQELRNTPAGMRYLWIERDFHFSPRPLSEC